jgi:GNAT superfamily N-acetyltransferase
VGDPGGVTIRRATVEDIDELVRLRVAMMSEISSHDGAETRAEAGKGLAETNRAYLRETMPSGEFVAYVAESGGAIVATSGLRMYRMAPHSGNLLGIGAYVLNMYTVPAWRGRGLASALLERLVEHARSCGARSVSLRATDAGRPVYERFGFASDPAHMTFHIADESPE